MATVLITGANRGIGLAMTRLCRERGDEVYAACRSGAGPLETLGARVIVGVDVTDEASVARLAAAVPYDTLDVLINNAGLLTVEDLGHLDFDAIRRQFEVNTIGPLRVTHALLGKVRDGGRVALITSRMGSIADNASGGYYGYRMSKAALNMAGASLARDLISRKIAVGLIHPGFVRTGMTRNMGDVEADEAARGILARIDELSPTNTGGFWHANGERLSW